MHRELRSPPARAGSFFGASRPLPRVPPKVSLLNVERSLRLGRGNGSCCGIEHLDDTLYRL